MERSRGVSDEELFLNRSRRGDDCDSPTVEPLRIFKPPSPKPAERFRYPAPPSSSAPPPLPKPSFLPPGALSSADSLPLPYPDDDDDGAAARKPVKPTVTPYPGPSSSPHNDTSPRLTSPSDRIGPGLAERRGTAPKPLSGPSSPDDDGGDLFAKPLAGSMPAPAVDYPAFNNKKQYYPPPPGGAASSSNAPNPDSLQIPNQPSVNRFASNASTSTVRASRGSPPPPETPIVEPGNIPGDGIEARYAASGISGTATLTSLQAQSAAAAQRLAQYGGQPPPQRPWTPTETPDQQPHGPPTVYQGSEPVSTPPPSNPTPAGPNPPPSESGTLQVSVLEQDFQRAGNKTPPPAYSSLTGGKPSYPNEKGRPVSQQSAPPESKQAHAAQATAASATSAAHNSGHPALADNNAGHPALANNSGHPALANEPRQDPTPQASQAVAVPGTPAFSAPPAAGPASPPPMPEGWIAHLDQNSGQYYYIHLATQSTQWEFPKGPNPLNHTHEAAPLSPTASTYGNPLGSPLFGGKQGLASPMFPPHTPGYAESIMSVATSAAPTVGFTGPPPSAGVDVFKVQPTNGVYFGPYLRYANMNIEKGVWFGSILIVTDAPQPPTIHIHLSADLSANPRQLMPHVIHVHQRWNFYKYDLDLPMGEHGTERWTYAITSHLGCTRYEFVVAGRNELGWRFIAHSGNDFAPSTSQGERSKLGGVSFMWKDVLQKNVECGGFHVQLGLGNQIYGDRLWKEVPLLKQWIELRGKENRKNTQWTARHEEDVSHAYFHYYTSHFDQPFLREAFAQIPHVLQVDDHDM